MKRSFFPLELGAPSALCFRVGSFRFGQRSLPFLGVCFRGLFPFAAFPRPFFLRALRVQRPSRVEGCGIVRAHAAFSVGAFGVVPLSFGTVPVLFFPLVGSLMWPLFPARAWTDLVQLAAKKKIIVFSEIFAKNQCILF